MLISTVFVILLEPTEKQQEITLKQYTPAIRQSQNHDEAIQFFRNVSHFSLSNVLPGLKQAQDQKNYLDDNWSDLPIPITMGISDF